MVEGDLGLVGDGSRVTCPTLPVQSGSVEVGFDYDAAARKMTVHIIQVRGVPPKDIGGANNTQVDHLNLAKLANFTWMAEYWTGFYLKGESGATTWEKAKTQNES